MLPKAVTLPRRRPRFAPTNGSTVPDPRWSRDIGTRLPSCNSVLKRGVSVLPVGMDVPKFTTGYHCRIGRNLYQPTTDVSPRPLNVSLKLMATVGPSITADRTLA